MARNRKGGKGEKGAGAASPAPPAPAAERECAVLATHPSGSLVAVAVGSSLRVVEVSTASCACWSVPEGLGGEGCPPGPVAIRALSFHPSLPRLLAACDDKGAYVLDVGGGSVRVAYRTAVAKKPTAAAWALSGGASPAGGEGSPADPPCPTPLVGDKYGDVWAAHEAGAELVLGHYNSTVTALDVSPDGRRILSADREGKVRVTAMPGPGALAGAPLGLAPSIVSFCLGHRGHVASAGFASLLGSTLVVSGGEDGTLRLWDPKNGDQLASLSLAEELEMREGGGRETGGSERGQVAQATEASDTGAGAADEAAGANEPTCAPARDRNAVAFVSPLGEAWIAAAVEGRDAVALVAVERAAEGALSLRLVRAPALPHLLSPAAAAFDPVGGTLWVAGDPPASREGDGCLVAALDTPSEGKGEGGGRVAGAGRVGHVQQPALRSEVLEALRGVDEAGLAAVEAACATARSAEAQSVRNPHLFKIAPPKEVIESRKRARRIGLGFGADKKAEAAVAAEAVVTAEVAQGERGVAEAATDP